jgi:hypothetical protein
MLLDSKCKELRVVDQETPLLLAEIGRLGSVLMTCEGEARLQTPQRGTW